MKKKVNNMMNSIIIYLLFLEKDMIEKYKNDKENEEVHVVEVEKKVIVIIVIIIIWLI